MSNPNRVVANMAKRPFAMVHPSPRNEAEAEQMVATLRAEGFDAKWTTYRYGARKAPRKGFNVWKRERSN